MNKKTKGLVALGAGAALMFGGAGTFALWFDQLPLGAGTPAISTGDLYLTLGEDAATGKWTWAEVSSDNGPERTEDVATDALIVPGDALSWVWTKTDINYFLSGSTIVANLYLDGEQVFDRAALHPLVITVNDEDAVIGEDGSVLLAGGLTAPGSLNLELGLIPSFTLTFPQDGDATVGNFGHLPSSEDGALEGVEGSGYGRRRSGENAFSVVDLSSLTVRLQQLPTVSE
jgi:alternate signal-mediated exported protein